MKYSLYSILLVLGLAACISDPNSSSANKYDDEICRMIADYQDSRTAPSLVVLTRHKSAVYRAEAALALASVQDSATCGILTAMLYDADDLVRKHAAYAIGQLRDSSCASGLIESLEEEQNSDVIAARLEAFGKIASSEDIGFLGLYEPKDDVVEEGYAWALCRLGARNKGNRILADKAMNMLETSQSRRTRLGAAHLLGRSKDLSLDAQRLITLIEREEDAEVRMALVSGLERLDAEQRLLPVRNAMQDEDHRVRINAVNAMHQDNVDSHILALDNLLKDENPNVIVAAAEKLSKLERPDLLAQMADVVDNPRAKNTLLSGARKAADGDQKTEITDQVLSRYANADADERVLLLNTLSGDLSLMRFFDEEAFNIENPLKVREAAVSAVGMSIYMDPSIVEGESARELDAFFRKVMQSGEADFIGWAAFILSMPEYGFKDRFEDTEWMELVVASLDSVQDATSMQEIQKVIAYLNDVPEDELEANVNRKGIDWEVVEEIGSGKQIRIVTSKGDIVIELAVEQAPSSASNFYTLAKRGFYDNTTFHRVVPNFVIQAGRGSEDVEPIDYSIRSELGPASYVAGAVGMASAGKDTEGSQWFITHSPTPHLDGRYSIFAYVVEGMDVVQQIELEDRIERMLVVK